MRGQRRSARRVAPNKTHIACYYHGIDPETLQAVRVSVTHGCQATRYGGGKPPYSFIVPTLREAEAEIRIVLHLEQMFMVLSHRLDDPLIKQRVDALEARAAQMREEQRVYQEAYTKTV